MSFIPGTNVAAPIVPFDTLDTYPTHDSFYGLGGWREVATLPDRDAIPDERRRDGMVVYVKADNSHWQLRNGLWTPFSIVGAGGIQWKGVWDAVTQYKANDAVSYSGSSYVAKLDNVGVQPDGNASTWDTLAQGAGSDGLPSLQDFLITSTGEFQLLSVALPPGNYNVFLYYRTFLPGKFTFRMTYQDGAGAQSSLLTTGFVPQGSFRTYPAFINVAASSALTTYANADQINNVWVSLAFQKI